MKHLSRHAVALFGLALWFSAAPVVNGMELPTNCWQALKGLKQSNHQYYDVPAWNCNGSLLLIIGAEQPEGQKPIRRSYLVAKLGGNE